MTRLMFAAAISAVSAIAAPAFAQHHASMAHTGYGANPCLLGSMVAGQCVGPVQVTEQVLVTSGGPVQPVVNVQRRPDVPANWDPNGPATSYIVPGPAGMPAPATGCVRAQAVQSIRCEGNWVYSQPVPMPAPAPVTYVAPPVQSVPVPACCAAADIAPGSIPLSFFVGGANNGVGFNSGAGYYGGGGGIVIQSSGTRFSGVREAVRSPLTPPPRRPPAGGHNPPPHHGGGGCGGCH
jgi:hypothetical protein